MASLRKIFEILHHLFCIFEFFLFSSLSILPNGSPAPKGCAFATVGSQCLVYIQLKGLVDAEKEIRRLEETLGKKTAQRDKLIENTKTEGYEEKVRERFHSSKQLCCTETTAVLKLPIAQLSAS